MNTSGNYSFLPSHIRALKEKNQEMKMEIDILVSRDAMRHGATKDDRDSFCKMVPNAHFPIDMCVCGVMGWAHQIHPTQTGRKGVHRMG